MCKCRKMWVRHLAHNVLQGGYNGYQMPQQRSVHFLPKVFLLDETKPRPEPENRETAR